MIKVVRPAIPVVLQQNQQRWTDELFKLIGEYGSYTDIPDKLRDNVVNNYRKDAIKVAVSDITKGKCVFCESYIENIDYPNIEHFYPKAVFPKYTFKWTNLFPACRKCNIPKGNINIKENPIVNPEKDNPEDYFTFSDLRIKPSPISPSEIKSKNTIRICNLKRISLTRAYAMILPAFYELEDKLAKVIEKIKTLVQKAAQVRYAIEILDVLDNLKNDASFSQQFAGYLRCLIKSSETINESIKIVNDYKIEVGLSSNYRMSWD
jgi:uncharacterized protein (TIGR02646 family)